MYIKFLFIFVMADGGVFHSNPSFLVLISIRFSKKKKILTDYEVCTYFVEFANKLK